MVKFGRLTICPQMSWESSTGPAQQEHLSSTPMQNLINESKDELMIQVFISKGVTRLFGTW